MLLQVNLTSPWAVLVNTSSLTSSDLNPYPRPQLLRPAAGPVYANSWWSLNGRWEWSPQTAEQQIPFGRTLSSSILVPFPPESLLSGVNEVGIQHMLYRRTFMVCSNASLAGLPQGNHVTLHASTACKQQDPLRLVALLQVHLQFLQHAPRIKDVQMLYECTSSG